jgi:hypothetical protein
LKATPLLLSGTPIAYESSGFSYFLALSPDTHLSFRPVQTSLSAATSAPFLFEVAALLDVKAAGSPIETLPTIAQISAHATTRALGEPQAIAAKNTLPPGHPLLALT